MKITNTYTYTYYYIFPITFSPPLCLLLDTAGEPLTSPTHKHIYFPKQTEMSELAWVIRLVNTADWIPQCFKLFYMLLFIYDWFFFFLKWPTADKHYWSWPQDSDAIWVKLIHSDVKDTTVILHNHQKEQKGINSIAFLGTGCQSLSDV